MQRRRILAAALPVTASLFVPRLAYADNPNNWFRPLRLDSLGSVLEIDQGESDLDDAVKWLQFAVVELNASVSGGRSPATPLGWNEDAFQDAYDKLQEKIDYLHVVKPSSYPSPSISDFKNRFTVRNQLRAMSAQALAELSEVTKTRQILAEQLAFSVSLYDKATALSTLGYTIVDEGLEHSEFLAALGPAPFYEFVFKGFDIVAFAESIDGLGKRAHEIYERNERTADTNKIAWLNYAYQIEQLLKIEAAVLSEGTTELDLLRKKIQSSDNKLAQFESQLNVLQNFLENSQDELKIVENYYNELLLRIDRTNMQRQQYTEQVRSLYNIVHYPDNFYDACPNQPPSPYSTCIHHEEKRHWMDKATRKLLDAQEYRASLELNYSSLTDEAQRQKGLLNQHNHRIEQIKLEADETSTQSDKLKQEIFLMRIEFETLNRDVQIEFSILENRAEQDAFAYAKSQIDGQKN